MPKAKPKTKLTPKQQAFVDHYIFSCDPQAACIAAGYPEKHAYTMAYDLLRHPAIRKLVDEHRRNQRSTFNDIHLDMITKLRDIIAADTDDFATWDENKTKLIPSHLIPKAKKKAIIEINSFVTTRQTKKDDKVVSSSVKVANKLKLVDKIKAMELLAKLTGALESDKEDAGASATKNVVVFKLPEGTKQLEAEYDSPSTAS